MASEGDQNLPPVNLTQSNAEQFSHWYSFYSYTLLHQAGPNCYPNYTTSEFPQYAKWLHVEGETNICKSMVTCLLQNIDDFDKADMQSATIILGLMPTILSYIGPTVREMTNSPGESLKKDVGSLVLHKQTPFRAAVISTAQYLLGTVLGCYQLSA